MKNSVIMARVAGAAALLGMVACTSMLSMDAIKSSISEGVKSQLGLQIASVTCPESHPMKVADSFECTATPAVGGRLVVKVTQKDDKGNISWEVVKAEGLLDLAALETVIKNGLKETDDLEATVSCGSKYRATEPGKSFECTATDAEGAKSQVAVLMKDASGNVTYSLVQPQ